MQLAEWETRIKKWGVDRGEDEILVHPYQISTRLFLIMQELVQAYSEVQDGHRPDFVYFQDEKPLGFGPEIAAAVIRLIHLCSLLGIDIERMLALKMEYFEGYCEHERRVGNPR